ncbi:hypothetical protein LOZ58_000829 [Ophidiomyces ophidiicola]|nr:hypothetical protein LOZ65_000724 [Ophidiomyces ophidiicola]KAI1965928.1 hypothetical protein LOZ58_000829 [Ophidiomyces ophidiicola]
MEIPLPAGRSLHACQAAFRIMEHEYPYPYRQTFPAPPIPPQISPGLRKRPLPAISQDKSAPAPRAIQPKPAPSAEAFQAPQARPALQIPRLPDPARGEPPRKRGRPSKVEIQRRAQMAQARGEQYPAPKRPIAKKGFGPSSPTIMAATEPMSSPSGAAPRPMLNQHRHDGVGFPGAREESSQTEDMQVRRMAAAQAAVFGDHSPSLTKESMPRTLEGQMAPSPTSFPTFRNIMQPSAGNPGSRHDAMAANIAEAETGVDSAHAMLDDHRET